MLSSPRVATLNNQKAVIKAGTDEFFVTDVSSNTVTGTAATTSRDVTLTPFFSGIALDVTPQISEDGEVILHIHPTVSEVTDQTKELTVSGETDALPLAFSEIRESDSVVRASSGQIIVIGGLMRNASRNSRAVRAWFGEIPGLKRLFKSTRESRVKTELVILLRPIVVDEDADWPRIIQPAADRLTALGTPTLTVVANEARKRIRLGDLLLEKKLISEQQLKEALDEQRTSGRKLGRVLTDIGAVSEAELHSCLATALQIPFVDLAQFALDPKIVTKLPETHARRHRALVLQEDARGYLVGMADPTDLFAYDELARVLGKPMRLALAKEAALLRTIDLVYRRTEQIVSLAEELDEELSEADVDIESLSAEEGSPDAPVIRLIQTMFQDAVHVNASDIHIEPGERCLRVRQRVDGVLQEQIIDGNRVAQALVTRLKLMCGLDIAEKRLPQDGRFSIKVEDKSLDVRLATMPMYHGESIVLRLLDQSASQMSFERARHAERTCRALPALDRAPRRHGAGDRPHRQRQDHHAVFGAPAPELARTKIITAEDPVEYRLERVNQVQVNAKIGLTSRRPAHDAAPGSRRHPGRRNARPRNRRDRAARRDHRPPRVLDAAHAERRSRP